TGGVGLDRLDCFWVSDPGSTTKRSLSDDSPLSRVQNIWQNKESVIIPLQTANREMGSIHNVNVSGCIGQNMSNNALGYAESGGPEEKDSKKVYMSDEQWDKKCNNDDEDDEAHGRPCSAGTRKNVKISMAIMALVEWRALVEGLGLVVSSGYVSLELVTLPARN
ncbi:7452_t:CDS:2, partial [Acaulospora colombiana]